MPPHGRIVVERRATRRSRACSARGCWSEVERFGLAEVPGNGPGWTDRGRRHDPARRRAARHAGARAARPPQPAERARRARGGAPRGRAGQARARRAREVPAACKRRHGSARARCAASPSTTISRIIRPRSRRRSTALRRKVGAARILAVLEPRSNTMKLGAMKDALPGSLAPARPRVLLRGEPRLGRRRRARAARREGHRARRPRRRSSQAIAREARAGDHVLVMSNGGFGGIHEKLLRGSLQ